VHEAKVLTVSDSVHTGARQDRTGPRVVAFLEGHGFTVVVTDVVADGVDSVADALRSLVDGFHGLVVTAGGTGFAPTDRTPEGTRAVLDRMAPGLAEAMRSANPLGRLSRGVAGTLGTALVVNVPGSPDGAVECLEAIVDVVPHALDLLGGGRPH
jgi:molybdenum cofactor synthesis domain-containing protein